MPPLLDVLQEEGTVSPVHLSDPKIVSSSPCYLLAFSPEAQQCLHGSKKPCWQPLKLESLIPTGCKTHKISTPLFFLVDGSGKCSPCVITCVRLSLFLAFFHNQSSLPSAAPMIFFFSRPRLITSYIPWYGLFSSSNCAVCSVSLQINFLDIQNGLVLIQLCLKEEASLWSSYYSDILAIPSTHILVHSQQLSFSLHMVTTIIQLSFLTLLYASWDFTI